MSKPTPSRTYGWIPQPRDLRDLMYEPRPTTLAARPPLFDMRWMCPPVWDQGNLGSCTGEGVAAVHMFDQMKQGGAVFTPSVLGIYFGERKRNGTTKSDAGANIRDGIKVVASEGAGNETLWPYVISKFAVTPPPAYYADAKRHTSVLYQAVRNDPDQIGGCLAEGFPIVLGIAVYESFESAKVAATGVASMPKRGERLLGGHCIVIVGYDDTKKIYFCRNSWGVDWGMAGYFTLPQAYVAGYGSDLWQVSQVR